MPRKVFYSFHYQPDVHRVAKLRNIGVIEGNRPATDNGWESVKSAGEGAIKKWIEAEMSGRSCTLVLAGARTAGRKWITHEIVRSWDRGMGVAVIYIHGISNLAGVTTAKGANPLESVTHGPTQRRLSSIAKAYTPPGADSPSRYRWIAANVEAIIEEAIKIRKASV